MKSEGGDNWIALSVLEAVSDARGVDPMSLPPLGDRIDGDALQQVVESASVDLEIVLSVYGCRVEIDDQGNVAVVESPDGP